ncbi:MAG: sodium:calcium antiporter, partial [Clostridia bacterium]|nr:sodium:calcium antiporter [Clostridia bacterium]
IGITGLIIPVPFEVSFLVDCIIAAAAGVLLWLCVFRKKKLKLADGIIMLVSYAAYFLYLLVK